MWFKNEFLQSGNNSLDRPVGKVLDFQLVEGLEFYSQWQSGGFCCEEADLQDSG